MDSIYSYGCAAHHVAKMIAGESFPLTWAALEKKYGSAPVQTGYGDVTAFWVLLERMGLKRYETAASFFSALNAVL